MSDAFTEAQLLFRESLDAQSTQRRQIQEDILFSDPSSPMQWEESVRIQRENDPGGKRPCLVMDQCGQYVANVAGQIEKQPPSLHAIPVGEGADKKAAEQIDGRFRHIEHASRATQHYQRALTSAARVGVGYLIVRPEVINKTLNYQEARISSEPDALKVVLDPWSQELDGCDSNFGYMLTQMSKATFEKKWPKHTPIDFGDLNVNTKLDDRKSVLIAEQWFKESKLRNMIPYRDENGQTQTTEEEDYWELKDAAGNNLEVVGDPVKEKYECIKWRFMNGDSILKETAYPCSYIGIVPVYGYVGYANGRISYCGIPRRARAPQQAYNYHISETLAHIGTAPKSPWLLPVRAIGNNQELWDRANVETRAYLPYHDLDEQGQIAQPSRMPLSVDLRMHEAGAAQALRDIQASIGMYQANIGADSNVVSGVAYDAQKQQGEASTAHFPSHLAASLGQVGKIVMEMDAKLSDTKRKQPIIGIDESPGSVTVDPKQKTAFERGENGVTINPSVGTYGVRVVVGASYATQRKETNTAFTEIMRGNKELAPVVAPFWAQTLDFPGSDKFAQAVAAMAPAPIKAILQPEGAEQQQDPAAMAQQMEQLKQALQEAIQHAHEAQQDADAAIAGQADAKRLAEVKERENDIKAYEAETHRLQAVGGSQEQIKAVTEGLINEMLSRPAPLPGDEMDEAGNVVSPAKRTSENPIESQEAMSEAQEPAGQTEPPQTSPELQAVIQGQQQLTQAIMQMIELQSKPRKRTAVRDPKTRELLHVMESLDNETHPAPEQIQ